MAQDGLVARYPLGEGVGAVARDASGKGNDGAIIGARWAEEDRGSALQFNGKSDYVEVPNSPDLNLAASPFTISVWMKPADLSVAMDVISKWSTNGGTEFALRVGGAYGPKAVLFVGGWRCYRYSSAALKAGEWAHVVFVKRHDDQGQVFLNCYVDGEDRTGPDGNEPFRPEVPPGSEKLYIGHLPGYGYFAGMLDEVRVYRRALSPQEILSMYKSEGAARGKDMAVFSRPGVEVYACPVPGKIVTLLDGRRMHPLADGVILKAELRRDGEPQPIQRLETRDIPKDDLAELIFDTRDLPAGRYVVSAAAFGHDGGRMGEDASAAIEWPGRPEAFRNLKVLNNLCWELVNVSGNAAEKQSFTLPCDRWVFIRARGQVGDGGQIQVSLDSGDVPAILLSKGAEPAVEAMRYLKAGSHTVQVHRDGKADLEQLVVRAIPALQHAFYGSNPGIAPYGPYDWNFLKGEILPNVNVMLSGIDEYYPRDDAQERLQEWHKSGRRWIGYTPKGDGKSVEDVYGYWAKSPGLQHPLADGIIIDEFGGGDSPMYDVYRQSVEKIHANPQFKGKGVIPYVGRVPEWTDQGSKFVRACTREDGYIGWEVYLNEEPTASAAAALIRRNLSDEIARWDHRFPGIVPRMICVLACMSQPTESANIDPSVDFKVHMDMQMRQLATHPAFFGLGGIQQYHASYADEETVRWIGRLYRHYAIEGNTEPLTKDPYKLDYVRNPDFAEGVKGWQLSLAEEGSMLPKSHLGFSWLQGRYPMTFMGDTFLWMRRSAARPNRFSQEIRNLQAGRLYSLKMISADYQDLVNQQSISKLQSISKRTAVAVKIDDVELVSGPKASFQFIFGNNPSHELGKFKGWGHRYWMNYHWQVFRAKGTTATLTVSDWSSDTDPGGPVGQETICNFIEVQPYFGD